MDFDYTQLMTPSREKCYGHRLGCKKSNQCSNSCDVFHLLSFLYSEANIPEKYIGEIPLLADEIDLDEYKRLAEYKENIFENVRKGKGIFLYSGNKGNGKTSWACKLLQEYFKQIIKAGAFNLKRCQGIFVNVPTLFQQMRNNMDDPNEEFRDLMKKIKDAELVVWDDIGTETPTKWVREQLYILINNRDNYLRANIYTSNVSLASLSNDLWLGERICDRIIGHANIYAFKSESKRGL